jgi:hypothetical protein
MSSARHHGRYNCAHMALFQIFLLRIVHLTLGEDLFTALFCFIRAWAPTRSRLGSEASFLCALRHLSQLTAVYLPVEALGWAEFRLISWASSN